MVFYSFGVGFVQSNGYESNFTLLPMDEKGCSQQKTDEGTSLGVTQEGGAVWRMRKEMALIAKGALRSRDQE